jgi:ADP-ribose pyrophosphatase
MERQYRYAHGRVFFEIPAGKLDSPDEDPLSAAKRELREETGAVAGKIEFLGELDTSPALVSEKIYMYLAEDLSFGECDPDDDEFLEIIKIPLSKLVDMVLSGEIEDGKTQSAVLRAHTMISRR